MTNTKKPIDVKIPPKDTKKHKPSRSELETRFVNYYSKKGYPGLRNAWDDILTVASQHGLNAVYLAAYLMKHGGIPDDVTVMGRKAGAESKRLYRTKGRDPAVREMVDAVPGMQNYFFNMGGTWGGKETAKLEQQKFTKGIEDPTLFKDRWGNAVTRSVYQQEVAGLNDEFQKYVARNITKREAINMIKNHWSIYKIDTYLSKLPGFSKGMVWKSQAPLMVADWETVYGVDKTLRPPKDLMRQAILRGAGGSAWFQDQIRKLPQYKKSVEYKGFYDSYAQQYNQVIGVVDKEGQAAIDDAIMRRMKPEEFMANLRKGPKYASGIEQQSMLEKGNTFFGIAPSYVAPTEPTVPTTTTTEPPVDTTKPPPKKKPKPRQHPAYGRIPVNARSGI